jgi:hypothetical protein
MRAACGAWGCGTKHPGLAYAMRCTFQSSGIRSIAALNLMYAPGWWAWVKVKHTLLSSNFNDYSNESIAAYQISACMRTILA